MNTMITSGSYDKHLKQQGAFGDIDPQELAYEIEKKWKQYDWERGELLDEDKDEREQYYTMTCTFKGFTFEGTGIYSCGELIVIDNVEIKK